MTDWSRTIQKLHAEADRRDEQPPAPMTPHMVACAACGLLVGWAAAPVARFYCIPCFDAVPVKPATKD